MSLPRRTNDNRRDHHCPAVILWSFWCGIQHLQYEIVSIPNYEKPKYFWINIHWIGSFFLIIMSADETHFGSDQHSAQYVVSYKTYLWFKCPFTFAWTKTVLSMITCLLDSDRLEQGACFVDKIDILCCLPSQHQMTISVTTKTKFPQSVVFFRFICKALAISFV